MLKYSRRKFIKLLSMLGLTGVLSRIFFFEKFFFDLNKFDLNVTTKTLTKGEHFFKVILISDLHLQSIGILEKKVVSLINNAEPDLLILNGDSIDKASKLSILNELLNMMNHKIEKVAILGNWEYWGNIDLEGLSIVYKTNNCQLLVNKSTKYQFGNKSISVIGVDDYIGGKIDYSTAVNNFEKSDLNLLLSHCPQFYDEFTSKQKNEIDIDLVLSGHTHGGQVNIFGFVPFKPKGSGRFLNGWYGENWPFLYVTKGLGYSILPIRLGVSPEVTVFNIYK